MSNPFDIPQTPRVVDTETEPTLNRVHLALLRCISGAGLERRGHRFYQYRPRVEHTIAQFLTDHGLIEWKSLNSAVSYASITEAGRAFLK